MWANRPDVDLDPKAKNRYQNKQENEMVVHRTLLANGRCANHAGRIRVQIKD